MNDVDDLPAHAVAAYRRTLRDIADGHLTLFARCDNFCGRTGVPLDPPVLHGVYPDRAPAVGVPDPDGPWWQPLIDAGLLVLGPAGRYGTRRYEVTAAGRVWLAATATS